MMVENMKYEAFVSLIILSIALAILTADYLSWHEEHIAQKIRFQPNSESFDFKVISEDPFIASIPGYPRNSDN